MIDLHSVGSRASKEPLSEDNSWPSILPALTDELMAGFAKDNLTSVVYPSEPNRLRPPGNDHSIYCEDALLHPNITSSYDNADISPAFRERRSRQASRRWRTGWRRYLRTRNVWWVPRICWSQQTLKIFPTRNQQRSPSSCQSS